MGYRHLETYTYATEPCSEVKTVRHPVHYIADVYR